MIFGSVCSGIEAASVAWHPIGWRAAFVSEIDAFPRAVLAHRFPATPLHGDFTTIQAGDYDAINVLVGGTPCQSFSVAGLRGGMADARGNLALEFLRLAARLRPAWVVWENVPGVLSSAGGRDFGSFLGGLGELGYGFAYRVLDAQYFGVPQRRRRVFVVGHLGDWRPAAAVLFEPASLRGNPPPSRGAPQNIAASLTGSLGRRGGQPDGGDTEGHLIARTLMNHNGRIDGDSETFVAGNVRSHPRPGSNSFGGVLHHVAGTLDAASGRGAGTSPAILIPDVTHSLRADGFDASEDGTGRGTPLVAVALHENQRAEISTSATAGALKAGGGKPGQGYSAAMIGSAVRRLTPRECERLQGFPDDWTLVPYRGGSATDGPRYKAIGNSMAVPVMRWIGKRIALTSGRAPPARD